MPVPAPSGASSTYRTAGADDCELGARSGGGMYTTRFAMLSAGTLLAGSVATTQAAMIATCAATLSVALVTTGVDLE
jgi:hypothetical protein